jgi:tRNA(Ile)-lysidine synthetase-like protein
LTTPLIRIENADVARRRGSRARRRAGTAGLEQRVLERFRRLGLSDGGPIVVGFSGGPDSLALAACLARLRPWLGRAVTAVHVDHRLRAASTDEASRARTLAAHLDLPCQTITLSPGRIAAHPGVGVEEAARRERYLALARVAAASGASVVAIGHHQQDQAETILLHLLRGSGMTGAAGMSETVERAIPWWTDDSTVKHRITIWRPLLEEPRAAIQGYLEGVGLEPIADDSNADLTYARNVVRHTVLPCLDQATPGAVAALARFGRLAADDDDLLTRLGETYCDVARTGDGLDVAVVQAQHPAVQRRMIKRWLSIVAREVEITAERVDALRRLALSPRGGKRVELGNGRVVSKVRGRLVVQRSERESVDIEA